MKIRQNVAFNFLGFTLTSLIMLVSFPLLLRGLGASQFGILSVSMSVAAALSFLDFGLAAASLRYVVADLHKGDASSAGRVMTTSMAFFGTLGGVITLIVLITSPWLVQKLGIPQDQHNLGIQVLRLTALQICFTLLLNVVGGLFKALDRFDISAYLLTLIALSCFAFPAILVGYRGESLVFALSVVDFLLAIITPSVIFLLNYEGRRHGIRLLRDLPDFATLRRTMAFGAALTVHGLIGMLFTHGQRLLVSVLFGPIAVSAYQLSLTLVSKVHAAINSVAEVALPIASSGRIKAIHAGYIKALLILSAMSALPLLFIAVANEWVINQWLGSSAPNLTAELLPSLCAAYFFVAISALPYHVLNGIGRPSVNVGFAILNIVIYVVVILGFELTNRRSAGNVAHAYAVSNIACGVLYQWYCLRLLTTAACDAR